MQDDLDLLSAQQRNLTEGTKAYLDNSIAKLREKVQGIEILQKIKNSNRKNKKFFKIRKKNII